MGQSIGPDPINGSGYYNQNPTNQLDSKELQAKITKETLEVDASTSSKSPPISTQDSQKINASAQDIEAFAKEIEDILNEDQLENSLLNQVNILVLAESIDNPLTPLNEASLLRQAAEAQGTLVISYNPLETSYEKILYLIRQALARDGFLRADNIAFVNHGKSGELSLTSESPITPTTLSVNGGENPAYNFIESLQDLINPNGRVDLLGCNIASTKEGLAFIQELEMISGLNFAASTNLTGSHKLGADWILETDSVDASQTYFSPFILQKWEQTLELTNANTINTAIETIQNASTIAGASTGSILSAENTPNLPSSINATYYSYTEGTPSASLLTLTSGQVDINETPLYYISTLPEMGTLYQYDPDAVDHKGTEITESNTLLSDPEKLGRLIYKPELDQVATTSFTFSSARTIEDDEGSSLLPSYRDGVVSLNPTENTESIKTQDSITMLYHRLPTVLEAAANVSLDGGSYTITSLPASNIASIYQYDETAQDKKGTLIDEASTEITDPSGRFIYESHTLHQESEVSVKTTLGNGESDIGTMYISTLPYPITLSQISTGTSSNSFNSLVGNTTLITTFLEALSTAEKGFSRLLGLVIQQLMNTIAEKVIDKIKNYMILSRNFMNNIIQELDTKVPTLDMYSTFLATNPSPNQILYLDDANSSGIKSPQNNTLQTDFDNAFPNDPDSLSLEQLESLSTIQIPLSSVEVANDKSVQYNIEITTESAFRLYEYNPSNNTYDKVEMTINGDGNSVATVQETYEYSSNLYLVPLADDTTTPLTYSFTITPFLNYEISSEDFQNAYQSYQADLSIYPKPNDPEGQQYLVDLLKIKDHVTLNSPDSILNPANPDAAKSVPQDLIYDVTFPNYEIEYLADSIEMEISSNQTNGGESLTPSISNIQIKSYQGSELILEFPIQYNSTEYSSPQYTIEEAPQMGNLLEIIEVLPNGSYETSSIDTYPKTFSSDTKLLYQPFDGIYSVSSDQLDTFSYSSQVIEIASGDTISSDSKNVSIHIELLSPLAPVPIQDVQVIEGTPVSIYLESSHTLDEETPVQIPELPDPSFGTLYYYDINLSLDLYSEFGTPVVANTVLSDYNNTVVFVPNPDITETTTASFEVEPLYYDTNRENWVESLINYSIEPYVQLTIHPDQNTIRQEKYLDNITPIIEDIHLSLGLSEDSSESSISSFLNELSYAYQALYDGNLTAFLETHMQTIYNLLNNASQESELGELSAANPSILESVETIMRTPFLSNPKVQVILKGIFTSTSEYLLENNPDSDNLTSTYIHLQNLYDTLSESDSTTLSEKDLSLLETVKTNLSANYERLNEYPTLTARASELETLKKNIEEIINKFPTLEDQDIENLNSYSTQIFQVTVSLVYDLSTINSYQLTLPRTIEASTYESQPNFLKLLTTTVDTPNTSNYTTWIQITELPKNAQAYYLTLTEDAWEYLEENINDIDAINTYLSEAPVIYKQIENVGEIITNPFNTDGSLFVVPNTETSDVTNTLKYKTASLEASIYLDPNTGNKAISEVFNALEDDMFTGSLTSYILPLPDYAKNSEVSNLNTTNLQTAPTVSVSEPTTYISSIPSSEDIFDLPTYIYGLENIEQHGLLLGNTYNASVEPSTNQLWALSTGGIVQSQWSNITNFGLEVSLIKLLENITPFNDGLLINEEDLPHSTLIKSGTTAKVIQEVLLSKLELLPVSFGYSENKLKVIDKLLKDILSSTRKSLVGSSTFGLAIGQKGDPDNTHPISSSVILNALSTLGLLEGSPTLLEAPNTQPKLQKQEDLKNIFTQTLRNENSDKASFEEFTLVLKESLKDFLNIPKDDELFTPYPIGMVKTEKIPPPNTVESSSPLLRKENLDILHSLYSRSTFEKDETTQVNSLQKPLINLPLFQAVSLIHPNLISPLFLNTENAMSSQTSLKNIHLGSENSVETEDNISIDQSSSTLPQTSQQVENTNLENLYDQFVALSSFDTAIYGIVPEEALLLEELSNEEITQLNQLEMQIEDDTQYLKNTFSSEEAFQENSEQSLLFSLLTTRFKREGSLSLGNTSSQDSTQGITREKTPSQDSTQGTNRENTLSQDSNQGTDRENTLSQDSTQGINREKTPSQDSTQGTNRENTLSQSSTQGVNKESTPNPQELSAFIAPPPLALSTITPLQLDESISQIEPYLQRNPNESKPGDTSLQVNTAEPTPPPLVRQEIQKNELPLETKLELSKFLAQIQDLKSTRSSSPTPLLPNSNPPSPETEKNISETDLSMEIIASQKDKELLRTYFNTLQTIALRNDFEEIKKSLNNQSINLLVEKKETEFMDRLLKKQIEAIRDTEKKGSSLS